MFIHEVQLKTSLLAEQHHFYSDVLGFPIETSTDERFTANIGTSRLTFINTPGAKDVHHFAFNIPENQIESVWSWIRERVELMPNGDDTLFFHDDWNAHAVYFRDPASNIVELIARHTVQDVETRPFTIDQVRCLSEIGLVADDVPSTVQKLSERFGIPIYGGEHPRFMAAGDENGLFIVVRRGRIWFPSIDSQSDTNPAKVLIRLQADDDQLHELLIEHLV